MSIVGLHRVPFDEALFKQDLVQCAGTDPEAQDEWRDQLRENWDNAWLVVVEVTGSEEEINFDELGYPDRSMDAQVPWLEEVLETTAGKTRAVFYLHYVDPTESLQYGQQKVKFPPVTPAPADVLKRVPYSSPG
jgi:hypothetical protein